jgi:hypothetical protein
MRLQQLFQMYSAVLNVQDSLFSENCPAIGPISLQLKVSIGKEITNCELEILSQIDTLVFSPPNNIGRRNPLALWVVLSFLILGYQSHMFILGHCSKILSPWIAERAPLAPKYYLMRHMYNALTSVYNALFKATPPLTLDWRTEEIFELLGRDRELVGLFNDIKTEFLWFREYCFQTSILPPTDTYQQKPTSYDLMMSSSRNLSWIMILGL